MTNKKILEVCLSSDLGGLELYMARCSNELSKSFEVSCVVSSNSKLKDFITNVKKYEVKRKSSFSISIPLKLARLIDKEQIDIVHLHWTKDIPIVVLAKKFSKRKPKIVQTRHMTMTRFKNDFYHKFLYKNIDMIIAVTKELEKQLIKFIPNDIRPTIKQVYLGAQCSDKYSKKDIEEYKEFLNTPNSFIIGLVGRINDFKGQYLLIEAMKILKDKNLNVKTFFVGSAMEESYLVELNQKIKEFSLEDSVKFLGFTNEPHKFMQACDCIVMASKNETFGLVTIEAMQMQTAVIGANSGGALEIIDDEINGLLFENRDSKDLALKIEILYKNSELKDNLAISGYEKAKKVFNHKKQIDKLITIIKK